MDDNELEMIVSRTLLFMEGLFPELYGKPCDDSRTLLFMEETCFLPRFADQSPISLVFLHPLFVSQ